MSGSVGHIPLNTPYRTPDLQRYEYRIAVCGRRNANSDTEAHFEQSIQAIARDGFRLHSVIPSGDYNVVYTFEKEHTP